MQIEVYKMIADGDSLTITLEAICDSFSSLLWDIEYYKCGQFEVYIAASPLTIEVFQTGRIVGRDDDDRHFGIIESVQIDTDAENGDYLTVRGRFLMCLLERRIIHPTYSVTAETAYSSIVQAIVEQNAIGAGSRRIPGLSLGTVSGACWEQTAKLQISYANLMEWVYTICEKIGGTANIRLVKASGEEYRMVFDLSEWSNTRRTLESLQAQIDNLHPYDSAVTLFHSGSDTLSIYGESIYTFYNDGYRSLAGFSESYPNFCSAENGYALYYNQPDFNWGAVIYTMCTEPVNLTSSKSILLSYKSGATDIGELWLVPKSNQPLSPADTARYIHEAIQNHTAISILFGWLNSVDNFISVLHSCGNIPTGEYHLAWKAVTDNTHPIIRKIKVLEVN